MSPVNTKCTSWMGHRFVARYSEYEPQLSDESAAIIQGLAFSDYRMKAFADAKRRVYERDVCVRCGVTIERATSTPKGESK